MTTGIETVKEDGLVIIDYLLRPKGENHRGTSRTYYIVPFITSGLGYSFRMLSYVKGWLT